VLCLEGPTHQEGPSGSVGSTSNHENKFFKNENFRQYWTWQYLTQPNPNISWFWKKCKWCSRMYSASSKGLFHPEDQKLDLQWHPPWSTVLLHDTTVSKYMDSERFCWKQHLFWLRLIWSTDSDNSHSWENYIFLKLSICQDARIHRKFYKWVSVSEQSNKWQVITLYHLPSQIWLHHSTVLRILQQIITQSLRKLS
jgi:hypothetical protein